MKRAFASSLLLLLVAACGKGESQAAPKQGARGAGMKFPVETVTVEARNVEYSVSAVGTIDAFERVQVTARVAGAVDRVLFQEGAIVKEGEPLAEIEPRRYQIALQSARAMLAKAESSVGDAKSGLSRREAAVAQNPGLITGEEMETFRTKQRTGEADVMSARAAVDLAALNLRDAYVRAPVSGVIETRTVQTGQYLQPGAVLATMVRRDPLLLRFQVPITEAQKLEPGIKARFRVRAEEHEHEATITHVGGAGDATSRMVQVTAAIEEQAARTLSPGAFAEVTIPIGGVGGEAPVIPQMAVRASEKGFLAFVVENEVAHERVVQLGMRTADGRVEIRSGLKAGEKLVIRGGDALRDGAPVKVAEVKK